MGISTEVKDLIKKCLTKSEKRLQAYEVLAHKWMKMGLGKKISNKPIINLHQMEEYSKFPKLKKSILVFIASQLSELEIGDLKNLFFEIDKDEDGVLSIEDFSAFVLSCDDKKTESDIKTLFEALDMSKTSFIDYNGENN